MTSLASRKVTVNTKERSALAFAANRYPVKVISVHDGDTFTADLDLGFGLTLRRQPCRLHGFDAWESSKARTSVTVTDEEVAKGKKAKLALKAIFDGAKKVHVISRTPVREKYGRLLVSVLVDGKDVASTMRQQGWERT